MMDSKSFDKNNKPEALAKWQYLEGCTLNSEGVVLSMVVRVTADNSDGFKLLEIKSVLDFVSIIRSKFSDNISENPDTHKNPQKYMINPRYTEEFLEQGDLAVSFEESLVNIETGRNFVSDERTAARTLSDSRFLKILNIAEEWPLPSYVDSLRDIYQEVTGRTPSDSLTKQFESVLDLADFIEKHKVYPLNEHNPAVSELGASAPSLRTAREATLNDLAIEEVQLLIQKLAKMAGTDLAVVDIDSEVVYDVKESFLEGLRYLGVQVD